MENSAKVITIATTPVKMRPHRLSLAPMMDECDFNYSSFVSASYKTSEVRGSKKVANFATKCVTHAGMDVVRKINCQDKIAK